MKGNQWHPGMKAHIGINAGAGCQGAERRPDIAADPHLSQVEFRIAAHTSKLAAMAGPDRAAESRKASIRGMAKNLNRLNVLFASANWVMRARAVALTGVTARRKPAPKTARTTPEHHHGDQSSDSSAHHACPEATDAANPLMISGSLAVGLDDGRAVSGPLHSSTPLLG